MDFEKMEYDQTEDISKFVGGNYQMRMGLFGRSIQGSYVSGQYYDFSYSDLNIIIPAGCQIWGVIKARITGYNSYDGDGHLELLPNQSTIRYFCKANNPTSLSIYGIAFFAKSGS